MPDLCRPHACSQARPAPLVCACRQGDNTTNAVPNWTPQLATPAHPEYPSGHQCTVGAALPALQRIVGDNVTFTVGSEGVANVTRTYSSLTQAAQEVGDSRWGVT